MTNYSSLMTVASLFRFCGLLTLCLSVVAFVLAAHSGMYMLSVLLAFNSVLFFFGSHELDKERGDEVRSSYVWISIVYVLIVGAFIVNWLVVPHD